MSELTANAKGLLAESAEFDDTPPVSDQALIGVAQGKRTLREFGTDAIGVIGEGELDLVVRPSSRGQGIGKSALTDLLADWKSGSRHESRELRAWSHGENPAARALLSEAGFTPTRELLRMTLNPISLAESVKNTKALPPGFEVVAFDPANDLQADDWVRVNAAAFIDHPEQGLMTRADFDTLTREPWFDPADLRLAYPTDVDSADNHRLAAFAWVKTTGEANAYETELYALGVDPTYAGRGLGAAMLGESLRQMANHRPARISLYVEGDNQAALPLYERAGFEIEQRSTQWIVKSA